MLSSGTSDSREEVLVFAPQIAEHRDLRRQLNELTQQRRAAMGGLTRRRRTDHADM